MNWLGSIPPGWGPVGRDEFKRGEKAPDDAPLMRGGLARCRPGASCGGNMRDIEDIIDSMKASQTAWAEAHVAYRDMPPALRRAAEEAVMAATGSRRIDIRDVVAVVA